MIVKIKNYNFFILGLMVFSFLSLTLSQRHLTSQAKITENELSQEIANLERQIEQEQVFFNDFIELQNETIAEREIEKKAISEEIRDRIQEIKSINDEIFELETQIREIDAFNEEIKNYFLSFAKKIKNQIENGIPFEKDKRLATISILISDLESKNLTVNESFSRINNFLANELSLGFDSQTIKVIENINGVDKEFELLRLGRIFFALIDEEEILVWEKEGNNSYKLDPSEELSVKEISIIKNISDMIQGRKAPEISTIPLNIKSLENE